MATLFDRLFKRGRNTSSDAKARLKVLLVHDEVQLAPAQLDALRSELIAVIGKYLDVEEEGVDVRLQREDGTVALVGNVPVRAPGRPGRSAARPPS